MNSRNVYEILYETCIPQFVGRFSFRSSSVHYSC